MLTKSRASSLVQWERAYCLNIWYMWLFLYCGPWLCCALFLCLVHRWTCSPMSFVATWSTLLLIFHAFTGKEVNTDVYYTCTLQWGSWFQLCGWGPKAEVTGGQPPPIWLLASACLACESDSRFWISPDASVTNYTIGSRLWKKLLKPLPKCIDLRVVLSHLTNCLCIRRV